MKSKEFPEKNKNFSQSIHNHKENAKIKESKNSVGCEYAVELNEVTKCYGEKETECRVTALDNITLKIEKEEFITIMGPSGSGKSTLLHIIGLLDEASEGEVFLSKIKTTKMDQDQRAEIRNKKIGFVFQAFNLIPSLTVLENVEMPQTIMGVEKKKRAENATKILERLGMKKRVGHYPNQLSGGEKQRAAIARALINDPEIILADEPTGNLDSKNGQEVLDILEELHKSGKTIIVVTHDQSVAKRCERIVKLKDGKLDK